MSSKLKFTGIVIIVGIAVAGLWRWIFYPATYSVTDIETVNKIIITSNHQQIGLYRKENQEWCIDHTTQAVSPERLDDILFLLQNLIPITKTDQTALDTLPFFEIETYNGILPLSKFSITSCNNKTFVKPHSPFFSDWYSVELLNHADIVPTELLSSHPSFWVDKIVFDNPQRITGIKASHTTLPQYSFSLPLFGTSLSSGIKDTVALYQYLSYFADLSVLHYTADTSINSAPDYHLVIFTATDTTNIKLYNHPTDPFKGYIISNRQPYVGVISWNVFDLLLYPDFLPSLK